MGYALRWWETLGRPERIVAMSLVAGSIVTVANSTVWAIAVSYMARQRARVAIAGYTGTRAQPASADDLPVGRPRGDAAPEALDALPAR
jgi:hypothetical protein